MSRRRPHKVKRPFLQGGRQAGCSPSGQARDDSGRGLGLVSWSRGLCVGFRVGAALGQAPPGPSQGTGAELVPVPSGNIAPEPVQVEMRPQRLPAAQVCRPRSGPGSG